MTQTVVNLDTNTQYVFTDCTPLQALQKMIYTLNCKSKCEPNINKTESGKHLWFEHNGETYSVVNYTDKPGNNYKVNNKVFSTLEEANAYANDYMRETKIVLCVESTSRKVTHAYKMNV